MVTHDRSLSFIPDQPWTPGKRYRLTLVSGGNDTCDAGELCGTSSSANFDPLAGASGGDGGGPALAITFVGADASGGTFLMTSPFPFTDVNGSGFRDNSEQLRDDNSAAMRIVGTGGSVNSASFDGPDCVPSTPEKENCMYLVGSMPAVMGEVTTTCPLPGGLTAPSCVPVKLSPQTMYGTSISMTADLGLLKPSTPTGMQVMRIREPANGPVMGYIIDRNGTPTMVVALDLYMDAPDMSLPLVQHDMKSKPLSVSLEGPLVFERDGRIAIALRNTRDVPISVGIDAPLGITGTVDLIVPAGEMRLQLVSQPRRARLP